MIATRLYEIVRRPHVSEKTARLSATANQYVFEVASNASKSEIKTAVEKLFEVDVLSVTTTKVHGKRKSFKFKAGQRNDWKKAYVSLKSGQSIDLVDGEKA